MANLFPNLKKINIDSGNLAVLISTALLCLLYSRANCTRIECVFFIFFSFHIEKINIYSSSYHIGLAVTNLQAVWVFWCDFSCIL